MASSLDLRERVAVVTGGSRGIGAATVRQLAEAGARVVFSYRKAARAAESVVRECGGTEAKQAIACRADVSQAAQARKLIQVALDEFGRLDILVANAGIWNVRPAPIERMTERQWDEMMAVNLKGVYTVIHAAVPRMIRQKSGCIIVVSSTAGQQGEAFHSHYGASKGGVISLVKGLATELAPHRIRVNCVAPGWVSTSMAAAVTRNPRRLREETASIPLRRFAQPEEIAGPILFLASEMASYVTGEVLNVNGGYVLCG